MRAQERKGEEKFERCNERGRGGEGGAGEEEEEEEENLSLIWFLDEVEQLPS